MTDQQSPPRFPDANAIAPPVTVPAAPPSGSADGAGGRPELLIAATFAGGFVTAKILGRLGTR